jgi:hypothetical protein
MFNGTSMVRLSVTDEAGLFGAKMSKSAPISVLLFGRSCPNRFSRPAVNPVSASVVKNLKRRQILIHLTFPIELLSAQPLSKRKHTEGTMARFPFL